MALTYSDRTQKFFREELTIGEIRIKTIELPVEEIFFRQVRRYEFDISELSLSSYLILRGMGNKELIALPVFLSRAFRHDAIYVKAESNLKTLKDLKGKRIGMPEWQMTACVWVRGLLKDEGISNEEIEWYTYREERVPIKIPAKRGTSKYNDWLKDMCEALINNEVDAIITVRQPPKEYFSVNNSKSKLRRLFEDPWEEEKKYYNRTKIFPIMHVLVIKRELTEKYPDLPLKLYDEFLKAKEEAYARIREPYLTFISPFIYKAYEEAIQLMGEDYWSYGVSKNWHVIQKLMSYMIMDGLLNRELKKEEIFFNQLINT
jgi:4,5-dihydroxyphthalate decarboxylase